MTIFILQETQTISEFHLVSQQVGAASSCPGVRWPGREANHLSPYSSEDSNARN